ncbi:MAG TPA: DUF1707 domain-containing protein [Rectinemataceae bacterium]|nr:DUF1707 domain-containing protein [Rectinemataceae bacterium]
MGDTEPYKRPAGTVQVVKTETIETLKLAFAEDHLQLEEFESRIAIAENTKDVDELRSLTLDLPKKESLFIGTMLDSERITCKMANKRLEGTILLTKSLDLEASMSTIRMDYRAVDGLDGVKEIRVNLDMSNLILYLPDDVVVENRVQENMSTFKEIRNKYAQPGRPRAMIRITGTARMSTIKVKRKRYFLFPRNA